MKQTNLNLLLFTIVLCLSFNNSYAEKNFFDEGVKLFDSKKFDQSKIKFEQDIVFNPKNEKSYLYLAKIFKEQGEDNLEENNLKTVILLNPKNEEALYFLAELDIKKSNFSLAKEHLSTLKRVCQNFCKQHESLLKELSTISK